MKKLTADQKQELVKKHNIDLEKLLANATSFKLDTYVEAAEEESCPGTVARANLIADRLGLDLPFPSELPLFVKVYFNKNGEFQSAIIGLEIEKNEKAFQAIKRFYTLTSSTLGGRVKEYTLTSELKPMIFECTVEVSRDGKHWDHEEIVQGESIEGALHDVSVYHDGEYDHFRVTLPHGKVEYYQYVDGDYHYYN